VRLVFPGQFVQRPGELGQWAARQPWRRCP
jgi:hypothetical protein